jgi:predicted Zn-dependent protease
MSLPRKAALVAAAASLAVACHKVEYTGRVQYNLIPDSIMRGIGKSSYQAQLGEARVEREGPDKEKLTQVGKRISRAADEPKYDWRFNLIEDDDTINAWCLPGGYIAFYTGILPVLRNEAGMAFVMGHETAHATAHHGAERMSQQLTMIGGLVGLEVYMANQTQLEPQKRAIILGALGIGTQLAVILPFSRTHESEADVIGMMYAAEAGYPPEESIAMWDRMEKVSPDSIPAFLSTHPSNDQRQANLREWMPRARKKYERHKLGYETQKVLWEGIPGRKKKNL